jgi:hypothetical protein
MYTEIIQIIMDFVLSGMGLVIATIITMTGMFAACMKHDEYVLEEEVKRERELNKEKLRRMIDAGNKQHLIKEAAVLYGIADNSSTATTDKLLGAYRKLITNKTVAQTDLLGIIKEAKSICTTMRETAGQCFKRRKARYRALVGRMIRATSIMMSIISEVVGILHMKRGGTGDEEISNQTC